VRRTGLLFALAAAISAGGAGLWYWLGRPDLPSMDLADPAVRQAVQGAMDEVKLRPRSGDAWGRLGLLLLAHDCREEAASCLAQAEKLSPGEPLWPYARAQAAPPGDSRFILACLERAAAGDDPAYRLALAEALLELGRLDEAAQSFRQALAQGRDGGRARLGLARTAVAAGNLDEARTTLAPLTEEAGYKKAARSLLAEVHQRLGRPDLAERERAAAAALPTDPPWSEPLRQRLAGLVVAKQPLLNRANELQEQGKLAEARELAHQIENRHPEVYWLVEARICWQRGDVGAALNAYGKTIELDPSSREAPVELAVILMREGRIDEAADVLRALVRREPTLGPALLVLGECERRLGNLSQALANLRLAAAVMPHDAAAQRDLGAALLEAGEPDAAARHLSEAARLRPHDAGTKELLERARRKKRGG
jgi:tetratricopeptide (TPR) repeat protein